MLSFLKVFGRGLLVTILLPFLLFVVMFFRGVIAFFSGGNIGSELPEDLEAKRIVLENEKSDAQAKDMLNMMYQGMAQSMAQAAFNQAQQQQQPQVRPDVIDYLTASENNEAPQEITQQEMPQGEDK